MYASLAARAAALSTAVLLQGCMTAIYLADHPGQSVLDEMDAACRRDSGVRWYGPVPEGIDLWLLGKLNHEPGGNPELSGLKPYDSWWGDNHEEWLSRGIARALYVNIDPLLTGRGADFGPALGEPAGIYRFELAPPQDPRCVAQREAIARDSEPGSIGEAFARDATRMCSVYAYVGPFDGRPKPAMFIRFNDEALEARGLYRDGERLIVDGQVRAGFTRYAAIHPRGSPERRGHWGLEACKYEASGILRDGGVG